MVLQQRLHWSAPRPLGLILPAADGGGWRRGRRAGHGPPTMVALPVISITQIQ